MGFEPTTFSLARRRTTTVLRPQFLTYKFSRECRDPGSNWGHRDFQSRALPTELSRQSILLLSVRDFTRTYIDCQETGCNMTIQFEIILTFYTRFDIMLGRCPIEAAKIVSTEAISVRREEWHLLCPVKVTHVFP